ncbi:hypothetical protein J0A67_01845 [Algoriphagus aestuariicola]|uniref:Catalase n=1 Tax=Algoriphagus aestuariicola TaxID=1852016 RepID=A0ABS3BMW6_9BACT|nr:hypothetical protein [Algoriphagus aestuariicola]MBN7799581.1 hypothetical protein [Algoriphagus aestuariicola]
MDFGQYNFFSWSRRGISANVAEKDTLGVSPGTATERASIPVDIVLNGGISVPTMNFTLQGPGDITGINADMVVRTEPRDGISNFEPNYLAYIEFYDEDFPWRYTPASATDDERKLRPWVSLIVLKETEFEDTKRQKPLRSIKVLDAAALQPHDEIHLWAHMHANLPKTGNVFENNIAAFRQGVKTDPDGVYSRVMCPRKLDPNVMYHAFLVPSFETGRLSGLEREPVGVMAQQSSWGMGSDLEFPVYYRWHFRTGANFDFESLVKLIEPRVMDERVGSRPMDCSAPGYFRADSTEELPAPNPKTVLLEGAVMAPTAVSTTIISNEFQTEIGKLINLNRGQEESEEDPIVTMPFYGMYHAMRKDLSKPGEKVIPVFDPTSDIWYNDLNKDPRTRVPAGFGVQAVQDDQENFMDQAWKQLNDVLEANRKMQMAQLMAQTLERGYVKNVLPQPKENVLSFSRNLSSKIVSGGLTVKKTIHQGKIPDAVMMPGFQKIIRPNTSIVRAIQKQAAVPSYSLLLQNTNKVGGLTAASIDKFTGLTSLSNITVVTAPPKLENVQVWSLQSNLDKNAIFYQKNFEGGLPEVAAWDKLLNKDLVKAVSVPKATVPIAAPVALKKTTPASRIRLDSIVLKVDAVSAIKPINVVKDTGFVANTAYKAAFEDYGIRYTFRDVPATPPSVDTNKLAVDSLQTFKPLNAYKKLLNSRIVWSAGTKKPSVDPDFLPAMAYPDFPAPSYKFLVDRDKELLLPNLHLIQPNTFSLLRTNQKFIESYLVGLNFEMGRELLWREYPTDMRGSYFRQFWDVKGFVTPDSTPTDAESLKDIAPIHKWPKESPLGKNNARDKEGDSEQLVFVIRGELLKKFPNTVVYAQKAFKKDGKWVITQELDESKFKKEVRFPIYQAELPPDIKLLGFDLTIDEAAGNDPVTDFPGNKEGWFFIIAEVPGEPRFGMDISFDPVNPTTFTWNDLSWENFGTESIPFASASLQPNKKDPTATKGVWGRSSADMASILIQRPVMVAVHATEMLDKEISDTKVGPRGSTSLMKHYGVYKADFWKK